MTNFGTEFLRASLLKIARAIPDFLLGNGAKNIEHEWHLNNLRIEKESLEQNHEKELGSLDKDIETLYNRRRIEEMTASEVLNEWDRKRGDLRERQLKEIRRIENDILYHQAMSAKTDFTELRSGLVYPLLVNFLTFSIGIIVGIVVERITTLSLIFDWFK